MLDMDPRMDEEEAETPSLRTFEISLGVAVVGEDDTFRTQNSSPNDWERWSVIQRGGGSIRSRVDLMSVMHGKMDELGEGDEATVVVLRIRLDPMKQSRRVKRAHITVEFFGRDGAGDPPVVEAIAPDEEWAVRQTTDVETIRRGRELGLGAKLGWDSIFNASASAATRFERTIQRDVSDATTVTGSINLGTGRNSGETTVAFWNLQENKRRKTGVPDSVQVAILLRRDDSEPFHAMVTLEADTDWASGVEAQMRGKLPLDDPVLFNPRNPRASRRQEVPVPVPAPAPAPAPAPVLVSQRSMMQQPEVESVGHGAGQGRSVESGKEEAAGKESGKEPIGKEPTGKEPAGKESSGKEGPTSSGCKASRSVGHRGLGALNLYDLCTVRMGMEASFANSQPSGGGH